MLNLGHGYGKLIKHLQEMQKILTLLCECNFC